MNYRTMIPVGLIMVMLMTAATVRAAEVKLTQDATSVKVTIDGKEFTTYHFLAGDDKNFHRPFAYPVYAADGAAMTSDQIVTNPKEHPHHRSFWVAYFAVNQPAIRISTTEGLSSDSAPGTLAFVDQGGRVVAEQKIEDGRIVQASLPG